MPDEKDNKDFFIGWAPAPGIDRRFLMAAIPAVLGATGGLSWLVSRNLDDPGYGSWQTGKIHSPVGRLVTSPYPMLLMDDGAGGIKTALIVAQGKCTSSLDLAAADGGSYQISGALIERKDRQMVEVPQMVGEWLMPVQTLVALPDQPKPVVLNEEVLLAGQIMDSKCFFGVMRPGRGKTHKACASLCIRGGIPPSLWVRTKSGRELVLLMTDANGGPVGEDILPLVAEPVEATGQIVQVGDILQFRANTESYRLL